MSGKKKLDRRGRRPSVTVAARQVARIHKNLASLAVELEDLESRLIRLEELLAAARKDEATRFSRKNGGSNGIRGKGPNVRALAHQILARRKKAMHIQDLAEQVLKAKGGKAGHNFAQNLGAALAQDARFKRVGRGLYSLKS